MVCACPESGCSSSPPGFSSHSLSPISSLLHTPRPRDREAPSQHGQRVHKAAGEGELRRRAPSSEITGVINIPVPAPRSVRVASLSLSPPLPLSSPRLCPPSAARGAAPEPRSRAGATEPRAGPTRCTWDAGGWKNELVLPPPPLPQPPDPQRLGSRGEAPSPQRATQTLCH